MNLGRLIIVDYGFLCSLIRYFPPTSLNQTNAEHEKQLRTSVPRRKGRAGADKGGGGVRALQEVAAARGEVEVQLEEVLREKKAAR